MIKYFKNLFKKTKCNTNSIDYKKLFKKNPNVTDDYLNIKTVYRNILNITDKVEAIHSYNYVKYTGLNKNENIMIFDVTNHQIRFENMSFENVLKFNENFIKEYQNLIK